MYLGIIVPKLLRYPHRLGYNNKMCWHLLANAARSTMRKSRISKVLPHPPFTSFTFPITPDPQSNFHRPRSRQRFFLFAACVFVLCLPPFSCRFPRKRRHFFFFCSSSSSNSKASRFLYFYNPLIGKTLNFRIRNSQSQMQMMPRPQATLLKKVTNFKSQAIW